MEQMTAGMTSYFLSISKLQASTSAIPVPALSVLSPLGSAILGEGGQLTKQGENTPAALSQVHLSRSDGWKRADDVIRAQVDAAATSNTSSDPLPLTLATPPHQAFQRPAKVGKVTLLQHQSEDLATT